MFVHDGDVYVSLSVVQARTRPKFCQHLSSHHFPYHASELCRFAVSPSKVELLCGHRPGPGIRSTSGKASRILNLQLAIILAPVIQF